MSSGDSAPVHDHGRGSIRAFVRVLPVHPSSMCIVAMSIGSKLISEPDTTSVGEFLPPSDSMAVTRLILVLYQLNSR